MSLPVSDDTNIIVASGDGQIELVQKFVDQGIDVNTQDAQGYSPM
jgi:hypothetical protein